METASHPSFIVIGGPEDGRRLVIDEVLSDFTIGSDDSCHLKVTGSTVSPIHAKVFIDDDSVLTLSDTKSRDGVYVNGQRVTEHELSDGDEVSLGDPSRIGSRLLRLRVPARTGQRRRAEAEENKAGPPTGLTHETPLSVDSPLDSLVGKDATEAALDPFADLGSALSLEPGPELAPPETPNESAEFPDLEGLGSLNLEGGDDNLAAGLSSPAQPLMALSPEVPSIEPEAASFEASVEASLGGEIGSLEGSALPTFDAPSDLPLSLEDPVPEELPLEALPPAEPAVAPQKPAETREAPVESSKPKAAPAPRETAPKVPAKARDTPSSSGRVKPIVTNELEGFAESMGGGGARSPVIPESPGAVSQIKPQAKTAPRAVVTKKTFSAGRVAAVAAVAAVGAWFAVDRYSKTLTGPVVDTFMPQPVEAGQTLTINGFAFPPSLSDVSVEFDGVPVAPSDIQEKRMSVMVPESLGAKGSHSARLQIKSPQGVSVARLVKIVAIPRIASAPLVGWTDDELVIRGRWLTSPKGPTTATIAGTNAEIVAASEDEVRVRVPQLTEPEGRSVSLKLSAGGETSRDSPLIYARLPYVEKIEPARGHAGDVVTIKGLGLDASGVTVTSGGKPVAILKREASQLTISAPGGRLWETTSTRPIVVMTPSHASEGRDFEIARESMAAYGPRFFVDVVTVGSSPRFAVSCELGPVLVLGTASDANAARAHMAASKLNTLASGARQDRVIFDAKDSTITSKGSSVLTVGPGDGSGSPNALARVWAAVLTDMFDLFFQGRRPLRAAEVSADGQVFLDIFAAARRRSSEPGVPSALLTSLDSTWARSLLALATSPRGAAQSEQTIDGIWTGTLEASGRAPLQMVLSLTATSSGLTGQRNSRGGGVSTPLSDLRLERRQIRFAFVEGGQQWTYRGTLQGDTIEGDVASPSGPVGKLTLKLAR